MNHQDGACPLIIFGAFDRHNFGDMLFAHVAASLAGSTQACTGRSSPEREIHFAGLAQRDLRASGGHCVEAIADLAEVLGHREVEVLHAGGELLACSAFEAAVMLQPPGHMRNLLERHGGNPAAARQWAAQQLGLRAQLPYCIGLDLFPDARIVYRAVGGVEFDRLGQEQRDEVLAKLRSASEVTVRDRYTLWLMQQADIAARLLPDPAVMTAELFGAPIARHRTQGEVARLSEHFPQGYVALQFSTAFGDDRTLAAIAAQVDRVASDTGYGVVLFRAGTAPWHDDLACYARLLKFLRTPHIRILGSVHLWDICALLAGSRLFAGSSLHGRIVAMAFGVPRVNLVPDQLADVPSKQREYAATWDLDCMPGVVTAQGLGVAVAAALATDTEALQALSVRLAACYRDGTHKAALSKR